MNNKLNVVLGILDPGEGQVPFPIVALDCPDEFTAKGLSLLTTSWQNGRDSFKTSAPGCYFGDTFFRVAMRPILESEERSIEIWGQAPRHLTHVLLARGQAGAKEYELFEHLHAVAGAYTMTIAIQGDIRLDLLHLVKYVYDAKEREQD